jgi:hypothetical protein
MANLLLAELNLGQRKSLKVKTDFGHWTLDLFAIARPAEDSSCQRLRSLTIVDADLTVHYYIFDPIGMLIRNFKRGAINHPPRIKNGDVRKHSSAQESTITQSHARSGFTGHLVNRLRQS